MDMEHLSWLVDGAAAFGGALAGVLGLRHQVKQLAARVTQLELRSEQNKTRLDRAGIPALGGE